MALSISGDVILDVYTFILALMLLLFQDTDRKSKSNIAFIKLVSILALLVGVSILGDIAANLPPQFFFINKFSIYFIFALDPLGFLFALSYIDSYIVDGCDRKRLYFIWALRIYSVINFILVSYSLIAGNKWFYYFDGMIYHRGQYYLVRAMLHVLLCFTVVLYMLLFRKNINQSYRVPITLFPLIVALGGFLQRADQRR